jgi:hypothetical protein
MRNDAVSTERCSRANVERVVGQVQRELEKALRGGFTGANCPTRAVGANRLYVDDYNVDSRDAELG